MEESRRERISKKLSYWLRHAPQALGIELSHDGFTDVATLLARCNDKGLRISRTDLETVVANCPKQRYSFDSTGTQIRANQGHSVKVDLGLAPVHPPDTLYHGTATRFMASILRDGLLRGSRTHVHLSTDIETAVAVGKRHGGPVVFAVDAARMAAGGRLFYLSANGVWLVESVPAEYLAVVGM